MRNFLMLLQSVVIAIVMVLMISCGKSDEMTLTSPNGKTVVTVTDQGDEVNLLIDGGLAITKLGIETTAMGGFDGEDVKIVGVSPLAEIVEDYEMLAGKRSHCANRANERAYTLQNASGNLLVVRVRAWNDGVSFRYEIPTFTPGDSLLQESTTFVLPTSANRWAQKYDPLSYEGFYPLATDSVSSVGKWAYPLLVQNADSVFSLITEAALERGHSASYLRSDGVNYQVVNGSPVNSLWSEWCSPWRVVITGSLADIVESTLVTDNAAPQRVAETSWIQPGPSSWIYWAYNHGSRDYQVVKDYIDLAAEMGWPYVLIDWEWDKMGNGGTLEDAVKYAAQKGVKPLMWYNSCTAWVGDGAPGPQYRLNEAEAREREFSWLNEIGVYGIKVDFFPGDDAETINYFIDILEDAARHDLLVTLHGATIPRGWQRTYPNLMTVEGVYGAEWYNNKPVLGPVAAAHNATLPFTRNVVGPMDYTPGTFSDSQHPHFTTHSHELALTLLFESAVQHMPDRPDVYRSLPDVVKSLLSSLPTVWTDTKLLSGYPGESVVLARRSGDTWFVAGINGTDSEVTLHLDVDKLPGHGDIMLLITDPEAVPREFVIEKCAASSRDITCQPRGGFVAVINFEP